MICMGPDHLDVVGTPIFPRFCSLSGVAFIDSLVESIQTTLSFHLVIIFTAVGADLMLPLAFLGQFRTFRYLCCKFYGPNR